MENLLMVRKETHHDGNGSKSIIESNEGQDTEDEYYKLRADKFMGKIVLPGAILWF